MTMITNPLLPLIFSTNLEQTKRFYTEKLGWSVSLAQGDYLQVKAPDGAAELAFMPPKDVFGVEAKAFDGHGLTFSIRVEDVDATHARMVKRGLAVLSAPSDRPWGWRSFVCADPNGVVLDFYRELAKAGAASA